MKKLIDDILLEWAMRSPDGLAMGHYTDENFSILIEILQEEKLNRSNDIWKDMEVKKNVKPIDVENIKSILDQYDPNQEFLKLYDTCNLEKAISIYKSPKFATIINAVDDIIKQGLGRGELIFLFLLNGCKSGGTIGVDLQNVPGYGSIEVKEMTKKDIKVSIPTLTGFSTSKFKISLENLVNEMNKNPKFGEFLIKVLSGKDNKTGKDLYPANRTASTGEIRTFSEFVDRKLTTEIAGSVFTALELIGVKLKNNKNIDTTSKKNTDDKVDISIDGTKKDFQIDDPISAKLSIDKISKDPTKNSDLNLKVSPAIEKDDKDYLKDASDLEYFKTLITRTKIADEISPLITKKISGFLVINKQSGINAANFVDSSKMKLEFSRITLNKLEFKIL